MLKKLLSGIMAVSIVSTLLVMPASAASFSDANKRQNYYDIKKSSDSNFVKLTNDYGGEYLKKETLSVDYNYTSGASNTNFNAYTQNRAKFSGTSTSEKDGILDYYWNEHVMGLDAGSNVVSDDAPRYVHQRIKLAWYNGKGETGMSKLTFKMRYNSSGGAQDTFHLMATDHDDTYIQNVNTGSQSMVRYNKSSFVMTENKDKPVFNTIDFIFDVGSKQLAKKDSSTSGAVWVFIDGKLASYALPSNTSNLPNLFYGWKIKSPGMGGSRQNDYLTIYQDPDKLGHTEYFDANGYVVTFEDVLQDAGLADAMSTIDEDNVLMKSSDMERYIPSGSTNAKVNDTQINENVEYTDGVANISMMGATDAEDNAVYTDAVSFISGVIPQKDRGIAYTSYHPRAKFVKLSFDQTIKSSSTQLLFKVCSSGTANAFKLWNNGGKMVTWVNDSSAVTKTHQDIDYNAKNKIDWVIEECDTGDTKSDYLNQYLYINGKLAGSGRISTAVRISDIVLSTMNDADIDIENFSLTLYNDEKDFDQLAAYITGEKLVWKEDNTEIGYERGYAETGHEGEFTVYATAKTITSVDADPYMYTAIYDTNGKLVDMGKVQYVSDRTVADETEENLFSVRYDGVAAGYAKLYIWSALKPQIDVKRIDFDF